MSDNLIDDLKKSAWDLFGEINESKQKKALTALLYNTGSLSVDDILALTSLESDKDKNFSSLFLAFIWSTEIYQKRLLSVINGKNSALGAKAFQTLIDYTLQDENRSLGTKILENKITQKNLLEKKPFQVLFDSSHPNNKNNMEYFDEVLSSSRQFSDQAKKLKEHQSKKTEDLSLSSRSPQKISKPASKGFFSWSFMNVVNFIYSYFFGDAVKNASPQKRAISRAAKNIILKASPRKTQNYTSQTTSNILKMSEFDKTDQKEEIEVSSVSPQQKESEVLNTTSFSSSSDGKNTEKSDTPSRSKNSPEKPLTDTPEHLVPVSPVASASSKSNALLDTREFKSPVSPVSSDALITNVLMKIPGTSSTSNIIDSAEKALAETPEHKVPERDLLETPELNPLSPSQEDVLITPEHVVPVSPVVSSSPKSNLLETPPDINKPVSSPASESSVNLLDTPEHERPKFNLNGSLEDLEDDPIFKSPGMHQ